MTNPTPLELKKAAITLARNDMSLFGVATINGYDPTPYQLAICRALERVERGEIKRLIITAPPQHMKSLHSSVIFPSYCLGRNPSRRVIMASFSGLVASRFGRNVRNISQLPVTRLIFPELHLSEDSQAKNKFDTTAGGYYIAAGRDGSITSYGADIMILDDLYANKQEAESEVIRENIWDTYLTVFKTRLNKDSALVMLMTRWHDDDLIGRVLALEPDAKWEVIELPAIAKEDDEFRKKGEALWPEKYPLEYLEGLRKLDPDVFSCMYQCEPTNELTAEFKRDWFKYFQDHECPSNLRVYITVDLAISKKESADESSIMVTGITSDMSAYILDYRHGKMDPSEVINTIFELNDLYKPIHVGIESVAYQQALIHFLEKEMRVRKKFMSIEEIRTTQDKEIKIRGLIAYYKTGRIYHRAGGFCSALEQQLLRFPRGVHDDIIDSLAMSLHLWEAPQYGRPEQKRPKTRREAIIEEGLLLPR